MLPKLLLVYVELDKQCAGDRAKRVTVQIQEHRHRDAQAQREIPHPGWGDMRGGLHGPYRNRKRRRRKHEIRMTKEARSSKHE